MKIGTDEQFHSKLHYYLLKDTFYYLFYYLFFASFFVVFIVVTSLFLFLCLFVSLILPEDMKTTQVISLAYV